MSVPVVSVGYEAGVAVIAVANPPVNTIDARSRRERAQVQRAREMEQAVAARSDAEFR